MLHVTNNTISSIGNTNAIAMQGASSAWRNYLISGNYLGGLSATMMPAARQ
jgi:hypothetical protein